MQVITRKEAKAQGLKQFFTGIPCVNSHIEVRSVANGICYQCRRDAQNRHRALNPEKDRQNSRDWYANNKEKAKTWKKDWIEANPEKYAERRKNYRLKTETRAKELLSSSKFNASKKNVEFNLDYEFIFDKLKEGKCEMTGIAFILEPLEGGRQNPYTASLDRIIPELGYVKTNVRLILWGLNAAFNSYGEHVYADIARVFLEKNPSIGTGLT